MQNQILRGLIFIILVLLVTSDLKEIISTLATSSSIGEFLRRPAHSSHQRLRRHVSTNTEQQQATVDSEDEESLSRGGSISSMKFKSSFASGSDTLDNEDNHDSTDDAQTIHNKGQKQAKKKIMQLNDDEKKELLAMKTQLTAVMQEWCLPKLVCELHASVSERGSLTEAEKGLLSLIRETSLGTMGEVVSRYHFAAHMGQLLSGVEGNGCHNFYPNCPLSGSRVLQMMKKVRIR